MTLLQTIQPLEVPIGWESRPGNLQPFDCFIGYLLLDALVGNTDRHHENWGFVIRPRNGGAALHLAPTFDHASSLGRSETSDKRRLRLETRDVRATVEAYARRAKSAFFGVSPGGLTLTHGQLVGELKQASPEATRFWADRISGLGQRFFESIFEQISPEWMAADAAEFALRMLQFNQAMIREKALG